MDFEWDEDKSLRCLRDRGFDFAFASQIFAGRIIQRTDARRDYGEDRIKVIGEIDAAICSVISTDRGTVRRSLAAWAAHDKERTPWRLFA